jgi:hypothetical protein
MADPKKAKPTAVRAGLRAESMHDSLAQTKKVFPNPEKSCWFNWSMQHPSGHSI